MIRKLSKNKLRLQVHGRIRKRVSGTPDRPRLCVFRSLHHIYAQVVDDGAGHTLAAASSADKGARIAAGGNVSGAREVGRLVAERAKDKGIVKVVFDRGGYRYHGRVKALAEAAREAGLEF